MFYRKIILVCLVLVLYTGAMAAATGTRNILLGPVLSFPQPESVHVWWHSSFRTRYHIVEFGTNEQLGRRLFLDRETRYPFARLTKLRPGRTYYYRVRSEEASSPIYRFHLPDCRKPFRIAIWADNQDGVKVFRKYTLPALRASGARMLLAPGDLVQYGSVYKLWKRQLYGPARDVLVRIPWFPVRGNHDGESWLAYRMLPFPHNQSWYARSVGPLYVVALDTNVDHRAGSPQYEWFRRCIRSRAWKQARYRIVSFHHPPFTNLWDNPYYPGEPTVRRYLVPLLEKAGADVVLSGHAHCYAHGVRPNPFGETHYITVGGGGGKVDRVRVASWPHIKESMSRHHIMLADVSMDELKLTIYDTVEKKVLRTLHIEGRNAPLARGARTRKLRRRRSLPTASATLGWITLPTVAPLGPAGNY